MNLRRQIVEAVEAVPITLEAGRFHPHITLARLKEVPLHKLRLLLENHQARDFGVVPCRHFSLFASTLGPAGAVHELVERYPLTDAGTAEQAPVSGT